MLNGKSLCYLESAEQGCNLRVNRGVGGIFPVGKFESCRCRMATIYGMLKKGSNYDYDIKNGSLSLDKQGCKC